MTPIRPMVAALVAALSLTISLPHPAAAGTAQPGPEARCAAFWLGVLDVARANPGYFREADAIRDLAAAFTRAAGEDVVAGLGQMRKDYAMSARAAILGGDRVSVRIYESTAERCKALEPAG